MAFPCANCESPLDSEKKFFCSKRCQEQAKLVRFVRKRGWDAFNGEDELMAEAYEHKLRGALDEGYGTFHVVTNATRATVVARDHKRCVQCGSEEKLEVDHIGPLEDFEAFNAAANLQLLCQTCHRKKTLESLIEVPMTEDDKATHTLLMDRIDSPKPTLICDDPDRWDAYRRKPYRSVYHALFDLGHDLEFVCKCVDKMIAEKAAKESATLSTV